MSPRIRLSFSRAPPAYPTHTAFMFFINDKVCTTVLDVKSEIKNTFKVTTEIQMKIDGFLLLESEDVRVLQHDDVVTIHLDESPLTACNHDQPVTSRKQLGRVAKIKAVDSSMVKHSISIDTLDLFSSAHSGDICNESEQIPDNDNSDACCSQPVEHETVVAPPESDSPEMVRPEVCLSGVTGSALEAAKGLDTSFAKEGKHLASHSWKVCQIESMKNLFLDDVGKNVGDARQSCCQKNDTSLESQRFHLKNELLMQLLECDGYRSSTAEDMKDMGKFLKSGIMKLARKHKSLGSCIQPAPMKRRKSVIPETAANVESSSSETTIQPDNDSD